jgi:hypothetical protein
MKPVTLITSDQRNAIKLYLALMEETKSRLDVINQTYHNEAGFPPQMVREICYLEFRFLCEIIGLGCLVIHEGIKKTKPLRAAYDPSKILGLIETFKPSFYPQRIETNVVDGRHELRARLDLPHLSKSELVKLWAISGNYLHRGNLVNLGKGEDIVRSLKPIASAPSAFPDIFRWSEKIAGLLNLHWLTLADNKRGLLVSLLSDNNRAKASILDFDSSDPSNLSANVADFQFQSDQ